MIVILKNGFWYIYTTPVFSDSDPIFVLKCTDSMLTSALTPKHDPCFVDHATRVLSLELHFFMFFSYYLIFWSIFFSLRSSIAHCSLVSLHWLHIIGTMIILALNCIILAHFNNLSQLNPCNQNTTKCICLLNKLYLGSQLWYTK